VAACRNCGHTTESSYCPECGQSAAVVVGSTAFTRVSDQLINWPVIAGLAGVQFYQLGSPSVSHGRRLVLAAVSAMLMLVFAFVMIFLFLRLARIVGL
jgi:hypothetical protein